MPDHLAVKATCVLFTAALLGCGPRSYGALAEVVRLEDETRKNQEQIHAMDQQITELRTGVRRALCRPDLGQLVQELFNECGNDFCPGTKVLAALNDAAPGHKKSLLRFMSSLNHVVFYLSTGMGDIFTVRRRGLDGLIEDRLTSTKFLIVVQPAANITPRSRARNEAMVRARVIRDKLRERYVEDKSIWLWLYEIPIRDGEILEVADRPRFPEPKELTRGVWLFRVDC